MHVIGANYLPKQLVVRVDCHVWKSHLPIHPVHFSLAYNH